MICYISHYLEGKDSIKRAQRITRYLQEKDLSNCYICSALIFSYLEETKITPADIMELRLDLVTCADRLIVADKEISKEVRMEIDFAKLVKMEVMRLGENGELRPFTE